MSWRDIMQYKWDRPNRFNRKYNVQIGCIGYNFTWLRFERNFNRNMYSRLERSRFYQRCIRCFNKWEDWL